MGLTVVIPVNNCSIAKKLIFQLLFYGADEIIIMDNGDCDINIKNIKTVKEIHFSHSKTRNRGVKLAKNDYVMIVSQDVLLDFNPYEALAYMKENNIDAMTFRQMPYKHSHPLVKRRVENTPFYREDIFELDKANIVFSNVCAIYKRSVLKNLPFEGGYGEDKRWAIKALNKGYKIVFNGKYRVFHSHPFSLKEAYKRRKLDKERNFKFYELIKRYLLRIKGDTAYLRQLKIGDISYYLQSLILSFVETLAEI